MRKRKVILRYVTALLSLMAVLMTPAVAKGNTVTLTDWTLGDGADFASNAPGGGGPFKATTTGLLLGNVDFITLCLEFNEHFQYGVTYDFSLSDNAVNGGVTGGNPDPVSDATKWLYYQLVSGAYASMYPLATNLNLSNSVGAAFQKAVWYLEGERTLSDIGGLGDAGYLLADYASTNQNWAALFAAGHRVYAMNLTTPAGGLVQDQLAYDFNLTTTQNFTPTQVPEPAMLLSFGTGLLFVSRRVYRKKQKSS